MATSHNRMHVLILVLLHTALVLTKRIGCKDERGKDVDWFINYKLPSIKEEREETDLKEGTAYAYILAPGSKEWTLSNKNVFSGSMIEKTLQAYYDNQEDLTYLFYNDSPPGRNSKNAVGHLKGVLVFDGKTGFWLIHSMPNFPDHIQYDYPDSAMKYGQTAICVTFKTSQLNKIANQLLFDNPNIYAHEITEDVEEELDDTALTLFSKKPAFVRSEPFLGKEELTSLGGTEFISFAKDNQLLEDLYGDIIAPSLETSLLVETWRNGAGVILTKLCKVDYNVLDISAINMTFCNKKKKSVAFESTQDHSKWAISDQEDNNYVCLADLNRMESQERRGGGALCFESPSVVLAFDSIIDENDDCGRKSGNKRKGRKKRD